MSSPLEPQAAFLELARIRFDNGDVDGILLRVAELAKHTVPNTAHVSVTLIRDERAFTAAFTDDDARQLDEAQYDAGHGPCLDAAQSSGTVRISDMTTEPRWPAFTRRALQRDVRSSLSVALPQQSLAGALNLYSRTPGCFDQPAVELAMRFAAYAAVAIAHLSETNATLAKNVRTAMEARCVIEQAKGILMAQQQCSAVQAFEALTKQSEQANRRLSDVAAHIVASAEQGSS